MSYLSLIFNRKREPSLEAAEKISIALGMDLDEFLMGLRGWAGKRKMKKVLIVA